jgi:hypothetical protein
MKYAVTIEAKRVRIAKAVAGEFVTPVNKYRFAHANYYFRCILWGSIPENVSNMPYETIIEPFENYIRVEVSGDRQPGREVDDAFSTGRQITTACRSHGVNKLLVIFRMTGRLRATEAHEIYSNPEEFGWSRDIRVALVDENPESHEGSLFAETVAVNRAYDTRVFENETEARDWLLDT